MGHVRLGVIADDLTGAADSGVQFAEHGLKTLVQIDLSAAFPPLAADADVLVVNTASRFGSAAEAQSKTAAAIDALKAAGCNRFFLKVDSALRGHVGECVRAALKALPGWTALVAPAYPQQGRTTIGGTQFAGCVPVAEADAGIDNVSPARYSHIPTLLRKASVTCIAVTPEELHSHGVNPVDTEAVVVDALDESDLNDAARAIETFMGRYLYVGAAGLARAVGVTLSEGGFGGSDQACEMRQTGGQPDVSGTITVSGSVTTVSKRQIKFAQTAGTLVVSYPPARLLMSTGPATFAKEAIALVSTGANVILTLEAQPLTSVLGDSATRSRSIAAALGEAAARVVRATRIQHLVLNGGDTALAVCHHLNIRHIWLIGEAFPGVPVSRPATPEYSNMRILSKSGGFGSAETLYRAAKWFERTE